MMNEKEKFPKWAPIALINTLITRRKLIHLMTSENQHQIVNFILEHHTNIEACSEEQKHNHIAKHHDMFDLFPQKEQVEVLEKLITNNEMETAWANLAKSIRNDYEYNNFWHTCMEAIAKGRIINQRSGAEHRKHFLEIKESASTLSRLLEETDEMHSYEITKLISDERINRLCESLRVPSEFNKQHARSFLDGAIPSIQAILYNIGIKADEVSKEKPLTKKPNSEKAALHCFIRHLSIYLKKQYGKPLHVVVEKTAFTIFDDTSINADYVRKLVTS